MQPGMSALPEVTVWCDGSSDGKSGGVGGWACVLLHQPTGTRRELSGHEHGATNNRMELLSAIKALESIKRPCRVLVYSDSQNVVNTANQWMYGWKRRGWLKADGAAPMNLDLVKRLFDEVVRLKLVRFAWVRGHHACAENIRCDELANEARRACNAAPA